MTPIRIIATTVVLGIVASSPSPVHADDELDLQQIRSFVLLMQDYMTLLDQMYEVAADPAHAAVFQLQRIKDINEEQRRGDQSVRLYRDVLARSGDPTIRNATRNLLAQVLQDQGRRDEAVQVLREGLEENLERLED